MECLLYEYTATQQCYNFFLLKLSWWCGRRERERKGKVGVKGFNFICYKALKGLDWLIDELMGEEEIKGRMSWNQLVGYWKFWWEEEEEEAE